MHFKTSITHMNETTKCFSRITRLKRDPAPDFHFLDTLICEWFSKRRLLIIEESVSAPLIYNKGTFDKRFESVGCPSLHNFFSTVLLQKAKLDWPWCALIESPPRTPTLFSIRSFGTQSVGGGIRWNRCELFETEVSLTYPRLLCKTSSQKTWQRRTDCRMLLFVFESEVQWFLLESHQFFTRSQFFSLPVSSSPQL